MSLLIINKKLLATNPREFFKKHFKPEGRKIDPAEQTKQRIFNSLAAISHKDLSLEIFLKRNPLELLQSRNFGIKFYLVMCATFKELGFDLKQYPIFSLETKAAEAKSLRELVGRKR